MVRSSPSSSTVGMRGAAAEVAEASSHQSIVDSAYAQHVARTLSAHMNVSAAGGGAPSPRAFADRQAALYKLAVRDSLPVIMGGARSRTRTTGEHAAHVADKKKGGRTSPVGGHRARLGSKYLSKEVGPARARARMQSPAARNRVQSPRNENIVALAEARAPVATAPEIGGRLRGRQVRAQRRAGPRSRGRGAGRSLAVGWGA